MCNVVAWLVLFAIFCFTRANAQQPKLFVGMILILIFAEALALYGLIVGIILSSRAGQSRAEWEWFAIVLRMRECTSFSFCVRFCSFVLLVFIIGNQQIYWILGTLFRKQTHLFVIPFFSFGGLHPGCRGSLIVRFCNKKLWGAWYVSIFLCCPEEV